MGADEKASIESEIRSIPLSSQIEEQLDGGWRIVSLPEGQLLLVPPAHYDDPDRAA